MQTSNTPGSRWPWVRLFARREAEPGATADESQLGYVRVALELLARCEELHQDWLEAVEEQRRNERLANAAAVYRWHLSSVRERLGVLQAPTPLRAWHDALAVALDTAEKATRLMSQGYRFHSVRRICDGGLLLEEARGQANAVREALGRLGDGDSLSSAVPAEHSAVP